MLSWQLNKKKRELGKGWEGVLLKKKSNNSWEIENENYTLRNIKFCQVIKTMQQAILAVVWRGESRQLHCFPFKTHAASLLLDHF